MDSMFGEGPSELQEDFSGQSESVSSDTPIQNVNEMPDTSNEIDFSTQHSKEPSTSEKADIDGISNDLSARVGEMFGLEDTETETLVPDASTASLLDLPPEISSDFESPSESEMPPMQEMELKETPTDTEEIAGQQSADLSVTPVEEVISTTELPDEILPGTELSEEIPEPAVDDPISEGEMSGIEGLSEYESSEQSSSEELPALNGIIEPDFTDSSDKPPVEDESLNIPDEELKAGEEINQTPILENTEETENIMKESTAVFDREMIKDIASSIKEEIEELKK
jgi:hypothetical protein